jgi:hypothetical protein
MWQECFNAIMSHVRVHVWHLTGARACVALATHKHVCTHVQHVRTVHVQKLHARHTHLKITIAHPCMHANIHTCTRTYTNTHTHTHTHTQTYLSGSSVGDDGARLLRLYLHVCMYMCAVRYADRVERRVSEGERARDRKTCTEKFIPQTKAREHRRATTAAQQRPVPNIHPALSASLPESSLLGSFPRKCFGIRQPMLFTRNRKKEKTIKKNCL